MPAASAGPSIGSAPTPLAAEPQHRSKRKEMQLYERCIDRDGVGAQYDAEDLLKIGTEIGLFNDLEGVMTTTNWLTEYYVFSLMRMPDGEACWRTRDAETAKMLRGFNQNERMVYARIEEAGAEGIWLRVITYKSNLHLNVCTKIVKELKKKHLVKEFTGSRQAGVARKMLILAHLEPSADNLGGAFYPDGELDTGFVEAVCYVVFRFVEKRSWAEQPGASAHKKRRREEETPGASFGVSAVDHAPKKRKQHDGEALATDYTSRVGEKASAVEEPKYKPHLDVDSRKPLIPLPPSFRDYPTTSEICEHVKKLEAFSRAMSLKLKPSDFETVLDMLCFDGRMEKIEDPDDEEARWRTVRKSHEVWNSKSGTSWTNMVQQTEDSKTGVSNGVSEAPCGKCPVFDLCTPRGPVNPENCQYYSDWLDAF